MNIILLVAFQLRFQWTRGKFLLSTITSARAACTTVSCVYACVCAYAVCKFVNVCVCLNMHLFLANVFVLMLMYVSVRCICGLLIFCVCVYFTRAFVGAYSFVGMCFCVIRLKYNIIFINFYYRWRRHMILCSSQEVLGSSYWCRFFWFFYKKTLMAHRHLCLRLDTA